MVERLLTAAEVGAMLGVSPRSVLRQHELGRISAVRVSPRRLRFDIAEVLAALREDHAEPDRRGA